MKKILLQLDTDRKASAFDQIVAYDAGVDQMIAFAPVQPEEVQGLVHGAVFTRGGKDLRNTAIFIGGSDVAAGEELLMAAVESFFGPFRVSVMLDSNGSNTTAAAAVRKITGALGVAGKKALVLGGTGPVGLRAAVLLAREGCRVGITSRSLARAEATCRKIKADFGLDVLPCEVGNAEDMKHVLQDAEIILAAGGAGVCLLPREVWSGLKNLKLLADINAVPPLGIEGGNVTDDGLDREGKKFFGAIAIGNLKMKIHKESVRELFNDNSQILGVDEIYKIAQKF